MSINLSTFWTTWGVSSGDTSSTNQYDFWRGIIMDDNTQLSSQYDFFKYNNTTRYQFFNNLNSTYPEVWDEYTFYQNTNDARIYDFNTFYTYAAQSLPGGGPPPAPYFTWQAEETITGECTFTTADITLYSVDPNILIGGNPVYSDDTLTTPFVGNPSSYYTIQLTGVDPSPRGYIQINEEGTATTSTSCFATFDLSNSHETSSDGCGDTALAYNLFISDYPAQVGSQVYAQGEGGQNTGLFTSGNDLWYKDINSLNSYQIMTDGSVGDIYTCPIPLSGSMSPISAYTNTNVIITGSSNYTGSTFIWDLTDFYETATDEPITSYTGNPLVEGYFTTSGTSNVNLTITAEGQTATTSTFDVYTLPVVPMNASGGTVTQITDGGFTYNVHTFTSNGTFTVNTLGTSPSNFEYLIVGGGGGGGLDDGGGGAGAGGFLTGTTGLSVTSYSVIIGSGGTGGSGITLETQSQSGGSTTFGSFNALGGGYGGQFSVVRDRNGGVGASGGGGGNNGGLGASGTSPQGNAGGNGDGTTPGNRAGGGGGGYLTAGSVGNSATPLGGAGGSGVVSTINGSSTTYCEGGDGGYSGKGDGANGTANRGNGGDGAGSVGTTGGNGGSGIVIVRYKV